MKVFEVGIYNKVIRDIIRSGKDIPKFNTISADFENTLYFEIPASSLESLDNKLNLEYPESKGFVIEYIKQIGGV